MFSRQHSGELHGLNWNLHSISASVSFQMSICLNEDNGHQLLQRIDSQLVI